jgi:hypothetical protein
MLFFISSWTGFMRAFVVSGEMPAEAASESANRPTLTDEVNKSDDCGFVVQFEAIKRYAWHCKSSPDNSVIAHMSSSFDDCAEATGANGGRTRDRTLDLSRVKGTLSR